MLNAGLGQLTAGGNDGLRRPAIRADRHCAHGGALDSIMRPADRLAVALEDVKLVPDRFGPAEGEQVQASAYCATSRSASFSPPPPIRIGGWGREIAGGWFKGSARRKWLPSNG